MSPPRKIDERRSIKVAILAGQQENCWACAMERNPLSHFDLQREILVGQGVEREVVEMAGNGVGKKMD